LLPAALYFPSGQSVHVVDVLHPTLNDDDWHFLQNAAGQLGMNNHPGSHFPQDIGYATWVTGIIWALTGTLRVAKHTNIMVKIQNIAACSAASNKKR
jgi:hypothetical protein